VSITLTWRISHLEQQFSRHGPRRLKFSFARFSWRLEHAAKGLYELKEASTVLLMAMSRAKTTFRGQLCPVRRASDPFPPGYRSLVVFQATTGLT
jgi:hypothetical protein